MAVGGIADLADGDYLLVHVRLVLDRISIEEAAPILALDASLEGVHICVLMLESAGGVRT